uniref:Uncharacterized protein n=1 Tax=Panagrellus redivivus TaxID=6233 RepID=A0A7E4ZTR2_PANRE
MYSVLLSRIRLDEKLNLKQVLHLMLVPSPEAPVPCCRPFSPSTPLAKVEQMKRHLPRLLSFRASKRKLQTATINSGSPAPSTSSFYGESRCHSDSSSVFRSSHRQLPLNSAPVDEDFYDDDEISVEIARGSTSSDARPTVIRIDDDEEADIRELRRHSSRIDIDDENYHNRPESPKSLYSDDDDVFSMVRN